MAPGGGEEKPVQLLKAQTNFLPPKGCSLTSIGVRILVNNQGGINIMDIQSGAEGKLKPGEANAIFLTLHADITDLYPYAQVPGSKTVRYPDPSYLAPGARRSLVRAVFAFIEGCMYFQRQMLLRSWGERLSEVNRMALSELQIEVTGQGEVQARVMRTGALNLIRLTVRSFEGAVPGRLGIRCEGAGFEALARSVKVRDRLMHPKGIASLAVSDVEINDVVNAFLWVDDLQGAMTRASTEEMLKELREEHGLELHIEFSNEAFGA